MSCTVVRCRELTTLTDLLNSGEAAALSLPPNDAGAYAMTHDPGRGEAAGKLAPTARLVP